MRLVALMVSPSTLPRRCRMIVPMSGLSRDLCEPMFTESERNPAREACTVQPIKSRSENPLLELDLEPELEGFNEPPAQLSDASIITALFVRLPRSALKPP